MARIQVKKFRNFPNEPVSDENPNELEIIVNGKTIGFYNPAGRTVFAQKDEVWDLISQIVVAKGFPEPQEFDIV